MGKNKYWQNFNYQCKITNWVFNHRLVISLLFGNHLAGPVNLVKLAWTRGSQYLFKIIFWPFTINLAKFQWIHFSNYHFKRLARKTVNDIRILVWGFFFWFLARFRLVQPFKRENIGFKDFCDKRLGWFRGFQSNFPELKIILLKFFKKQKS